MPWCAEAGGGAGSGDPAGGGGEGAPGAGGGETETRGEKIDWRGRSGGFFLRADLEHEEAARFRGEAAADEAGAEELLALLDGRQAAATFAVVGATARRGPGLVRRLAAAGHGLIGHGLAPATPVAIVENATLPNQRVLAGTLAGLARLVQDNGVSGPAVILIGEVAGLPQALCEPAVCTALAG